MIYHRTATGRRVLIPQMTDNHLKNTIRMYIANLAEAKNIVNEVDTQTPFDLIVTAPAASTPEHAINVIEHYESKLGPYVLEAAIRGLVIEVELHAIRELLERDKRLQIKTGLDFPMLLEAEME